MRRFGRKLDVEAMRAELPLAAFFFDCLHVDGASLLDRPAQERFDALAAALPPALVIPRLVTADVAAAEAFYADALARGHEGVMAKALDAPYEAGRRGASWLKVKRAHTLDLVVLAAEWGNGRRKGWLSNLHLGARDPERRSRRLRHARQDLQGHDRRAARLADARAAGARGAPRRLHGVRAPGARRRDRLQRRAGEPAVPRRPGAALRARQALSRRQAAAEADTIETVRAIHAAQAARSDRDAQNGDRPSVEPEAEAP